MSRRPASPDPRPAKTLSPTLAETLRNCPLRAAFRSDPQQDAFRKLRPFAALGLVAHALAERVSKGEFDGTSTGNERATLALAWDQAIGQQQEKLQEDWPYSKVPQPRRWPFYEQTRTPLLTWLANRIGKRRDSAGGSPPGATGGTEIEEWLSAPGTPLRGRPDRVEIENGGQVRIVDVKSSTAGESASSGHLIDVNS